MKKNLNKSFVIGAAIVGGLVVIGAIIALLVNQANNSNPMTIEQRLAAGKEAYNIAIKGRTEGATELLSAEDRKGYYETTIDNLSRVVDYQADNKDAWFMLGVSYFNLEQYDDAVDAYNKLIEIDPAVAVNYNYIANVYRDRKPEPDYALAAQNYKKAIELNPQLIVAYTNYALMLRDREQKKTEAITILEDALAKNANNIDLMDVLASTYKAVEQMDKANSYYSKILELDPNNVNAKKALEK